MSRIGNQPVIVPDGLTVTINEGHVAAHSGSGDGQVTIPAGISVRQKDNKLVVERQSEDDQTRAFHGTVRSLVNNLVTGLSQGFQKKLEMVGLGYRAALEGEQLVLQVGFTHSVKIKIPADLKTTIEKNVITVSGNNKQRVGQFAAEIRAIKPPEPYKGKGIRYQGEQVRMKEGKATKSAA